MSDDFSFLHAADLHIDSPLLGLARKSAEQAQRVADASRTAFDNLISLAIEEKCWFVLFAGDLFDGDWKDYRTGVVFAAQMRRLQEAGIEVYAILGNHDAENRFVSRLDLAENVHILGSQHPESLDVPGLGVTIHGVSYPQRDVSENLAAGYPPPVSGRFNIGLLHTACEGRAGHMPYAPCTAEQLASHGYDYWALGHVHTREVLCEDPLIIFPGNLQGRNPRETGPKGATLVHVIDGRVDRHEHRTLDVVRWERREINISELDDRSAVLTRIRGALEQLIQDCDGRSVVARLRLTGETPLHPELTANRMSLKEEVETLAASVSDDIWIEKLEVSTKKPGVVAGLDPSIAGRLEAVITEIGDDAMMANELERTLAEVRIKFPAAARLDNLEDSLKETAGQMARELAKAILARASNQT